LSFWSGLSVKKIKDLSQPGMFSTQETLVVETIKNKFNNVRIIGPLRNQTQVEISKSDAYYLGINPPIRKSGDLTGSEKCKLIGPKGEIDLEKGVIVAQRHLHLDLQTAEQYNLKNNQLVSVKIDSEKRSITFHQIITRVSAEFKPAIHLDTDEGNAAGIKQIEQGIVLKNNEPR